MLNNFLSKINIRAIRKLSLYISFFLLLFVATFVVIHIKEDKKNIDTIKENSTSNILYSKPTPTAIDNPIQKSVVLGISDSENSFAQRTVPILMYHYIRDNVPASDVLGQNLSVSPENFDRQMKELVDAQYTPILFQDLLNYEQNGISLPSKPIIISFDDGYDNHNTQALPILKKYGLKGSFAIITGFVGRASYMTWDQIKELKDAGNEIVSHTVDHPDLSKASLDKVRSELVDSKKTLDERFNQNTQVLVYPSGKYDASVIQIAKESGYVMARTTNYGNLVTTTNSMELPAIRMFNNSTVSNTPVYIKSAFIGKITCPEYTNTQNVGLELMASDGKNTEDKLFMNLSDTSNNPSDNFEKFSINKTYTLKGEDGKKTIYIRFKNPSGEITSTYSCTTTLDTHAPSVNAITLSETTNTASVNWNTDENSMGSIEYGINKNYGETIGDVSNQENHSVKIKDLLPCVTYHYRVKSIDKIKNENNSSDSIFTTLGCTANASVQMEGENDIDKNNGGKISIVDKNKSIEVNVPKGFSDSNANFQIHKLQSTTAINLITTPDNSLKVVGDNIYEMKALKSPQELISEFKDKIEVKINYSVQDITGIDSNSLTIYRLDDKWSLLQNCKNQIKSLTITCTTDHFSTFVLFGKQMNMLNSTPRDSIQTVSIQGYYFVSCFIILIFAVKLLQKDLHFFIHTKIKPKLLHEKPKKRRKN